MPTDPPTRVPGCRRGAAPAATASGIRGAEGESATPHVWWSGGAEGQPPALRRRQRSASSQPIRQLGCRGGAGAKPRPGPPGRRRSESAPLRPRGGAAQGPACGPLPPSGSRQPPGNRSPPALWDRRGGISARRPAVTIIRGRGGESAAPSRPAAKRRRGPSAPSGSRQQQPDPSASASRCDKGDVPASLPAVTTMGGKGRTRRPVAPGDRAAQGATSGPPASAEAGEPLPPRARPAAARAPGPPFPPGTIGCGARGGPIHHVR